MDYGEFTVPGGRDTYCARDNFVWCESSCWYFRPIHGNRGILRSTGWNHREGGLQVTPTIFLDISCPYRYQPHRDHEHSGMFAVCQPDVPCITPGTYAFLGAAAALR